MDRPEAPGLLALGLALVALGLFAVWLELGRPLRAGNVLLHLKGSWMSREALAALLLFPLSAVVLIGVRWAIAPAASLPRPSSTTGSASSSGRWRSRQARALDASPADVVETRRGPRPVLAGGRVDPAIAALAVVLAILLIVRWLLWRVWRERLQRTDAAARATRAGAVGTPPPVAGDAGAHPGACCGELRAAVAGAVLLALAGALAAFTGARLKFDLITRAGFRDIVLPRMPVRGVPRTAA